MARVTIAFLNQSRIPELEALQSAIRSLGFKLTVDEAYAPMKSTGYLPCTLDGEDAGVTIRFEASTEITGQDTAITLQWGGDPREQTSAAIIIAALAHSFGATVLDQRRQIVGASVLLNHAKALFTALD